MKQSKDFFWPSYVDLMTALFLTMLVLFVLSYAQFKRAEEKLNAKVVEKEKFDQIMLAIKSLEGGYFRYNEICKQHELSVDVVFPSAVNFPMQAASIPPEKEDSLLQAGQFLRRKIESIRTDLDVKYLIVVEGRAAKDKYKKPDDPANQDGPVVRDLSFRRAMSLVNFWKKNGLDFTQGRFEIVAAGSGYAGACRREGFNEETKNRRFVIQILPKVGRLK